MAFTDDVRATLGGPTKKTDFDKIAANTEFNRETANQDHDFDVATGTGDHKMRVGAPLHAQVRTKTGAAQTWSLGFWQSLSNNWYLLICTGDYTSFNSSAATYFVTLSAAAALPAS